MATVNFSVPDSLKQAFNETFKDENKSAIIAQLMHEAIERAQRRQRHVAAIGRILERRRTAPRLSDEEFRAIREDFRPSAT
jgi:hypothetical protein